MIVGQDTGNRLPGMYTLVPRHLAFDSMRDIAFGILEASNYLAYQGRKACRQQPASIAITAAAAMVSALGGYFGVAA